MAGAEHALIAYGAECVSDARTLVMRIIKTMVAVESRYVLNGKISPFSEIGLCLAAIQMNYQ